MLPLPATVGLPNAIGGRRVLLNGGFLGTAHSLHDLTVFLQHTGLPGWNDLDVSTSDQIEWQGGGPEAWVH
jgi:hypothetical protein